MTRRVVGCGADYVKVMASGGGTPGSHAQYAAFSVPELRAIVETAHGLGRPVAMHCIATQSIANAIEANPGLIKGLKLRMVGPVAQEQSEPLIDLCKKVSRDNHIPLMVHIGDMRAADYTKASAATRYL